MNENNSSFLTETIVFSCGQHYDFYSKTIVKEILNHQAELINFKNTWTKLDSQQKQMALETWLFPLGLPWGCKAEEQLLTCFPHFYNLDEGPNQLSSQELVLANGSRLYLDKTKAQIVWTNANPFYSDDVLFFIKIVENFTLNQVLSARWLRKNQEAEPFVIYKNFGQENGRHKQIVNNLRQLLK